MENGRTTDNGHYRETDIIETTDEDGTVHIFEKVSEMEIEGKDYALLIYKGNEYKENESESENGAETEGYDEEVVVMRITHEGGEEVYEAIEDEAEFNKVVAFIENMEDDDSDVVIDVSDFLTEGGDEEEESKN